MSAAWIAAVSAVPVLLLLGAGWPAGPDERFPGVTGWIVIVVTAACLVIGALAHRGSAVVPLVGALSGGFIVTALASDHANPPRSVPAELLINAALLVLAIGLVTLVRQRLGGSSADVLIDGLIVGLGAWIVAWVLLINPSLGSEADGILTITRASAIAATIVVLFLVATVLFSSDEVTPSTGFIGMATSLVIAGVVLRALDARTSLLAGGRDWIDAILTSALPVAGGAALHPSIERLRSGTPIRFSTPLTARLVSTTASLVAPIVVLALTDPTDTRDRSVRAASVCVLAVAVMARVIQAARANARSQQHLMRTALTDSLTGLPNRALMIDHVERALSDARKTRRQPTVLFIDVDRFKTINDSLGHATGDTVLSQVATRLLAASGDQATVARIAGDEFVVLDPATESPTQSVLLAERVLDAFREPLNAGQGDMFVTASIGVAYAPRGVRLAAEDLMRHADAAMYRAKDAGRNCIALFDEEMLERVSNRLDVETALYRALERDELRLVHQPIIDADLGIVVGFEALMRWDRGGAPVPPSDFIPIAEDTGTIVPLGSWALRDALTQLRLWIDAGVCGQSTTMSVNVSPRQLQDPNFISTVDESLSVSGLRPDQLWIEVTEGVMISEPDQTISALRRLHAMGVRIAIDDFGTGYSSLSLLQQFPVHCIKIDKSFVSELEHSAGTTSIVRTIVAMAASLGADIVAEGVEHPAQLASLRALGCARVQGYLLSRPVPAGEVPAVVAALNDPEFLRLILNPVDRPG